MKLKGLLSTMLTMVVLLIGQTVYGQGVTTSSMSGTVTDIQGETLVGANVVALHVPSGTTYGGSTDFNGAYRIPAMRVGGPYTITVTFVGFGKVTLENLFLRLGENERRDFKLQESENILGSIEVTAVAGSVGQSTGASTQISRSNVENMPTLDQNLNDFLRLTPQANLYGEGISFSGMNNRFNALYIDGAANNDVFGLASSGTNGGQTGISPFSIDIIDQLQVVLSPYDVTLGGFAGGGINAVTKSGTNTFTGSAYTYIQNQNFVGKTNGVLANRLDVEREKLADFTKKSYGVTLGGPIKKDKLFFFSNVEVQRDVVPIPFETARYTSTPDRVTTAQLDQLRNFLINEYNYDPGSYTSTEDNLDGLKIFGKIDYNINQSNYLTLRHQYTKGEQFDRYGGSSNTINFSNNGIHFPSTTNSSAIELNSVFGTSASNNLILSYVRVRDDRNPIGSPFPYVYIEDGANGVIRFGSEEFSTGNRLNSDLFSITNNFKLYRGNHTFTIGMHHEFYSLYNLFMSQGFGVYRFRSLDDFMNKRPAYQYNRTYSLVDDIPGDGSKAASDFNAMQLGFYVQDEWNVNPQLSLTAGLRVDIPVITTTPMMDTYLRDTALPKMREAYDVAEQARAGKAPDGQIMFSPRLGFTYSPESDAIHALRGGVGVFTSRIPFVWPATMFSSNGMMQGSVNQNNLGGSVEFRPDINNQYKHPDFTIPSGQVDLFGKDFKYPQVFRTNLAMDLTLPGEIAATVEGVFTKTLNNLVYTNINSDPTPSFQWTGSPDNRNVYSRNSIDRTYSAVYLATNTNKGYSYNLSATLAKQFSRAFDATVAYSYGDSYALSEGTSSQNSSQWRGQVNINGRNSAEYGRSDFAAGHRVLSSVSYKHNWSRSGANATTFSLFFNGQSGSPFSYVIGGNNGRNVNNETGSTSANRSLIYIPRDASEINLVNYTSGGRVVTAAEQWDRLNAVINDDKYLKNNRGRYAEKNASWAPFETMFDVAIRQDFGVVVGGQMQRLQLSFDIQNFANLLNNEWGARYYVPGNFNNYYLTTFEGYEADGTTPRFTFREDGVGLDRYEISGTSSRWRMRVGVRYLFN